MTKEKVIHKRVIGATKFGNSYIGTACNSNEYYPNSSDSWEKVTCKRCSKLNILK